MQKKFCHNFISAIRKLNTHSIVARTGLLFPQNSFARLVTPASHLFKIENRRFYTIKMDGDVVHDKENSLFFVKLTNDGGKSLLSTQLFCSTSITGLENVSS